MSHTQHTDTVDTDADTQTITAKIFHSREFDTTLSDEDHRHVQDLVWDAARSGGEITPVDFGAYYEYVATDEFERDLADEAATEAIWQRWNTGSGSESDAYHAEQQRRYDADGTGLRSLSVGDIVVINGHAFIYESFGTRHLPALDAPGAE